MSTKVQTQAKVSLAPKSGVAQTQLLQRKCACGGSSGVDGECAECRAKRLNLQRRAITPSTSSQIVPPVVYDVLHSSGQLLDSGTHLFMEPLFGHDFSNVKVHTDTQAAESASAINALAYTIGRDIVFGTGQYKPGTNEGNRLLAHELTHVMQQTGLHRYQIQRQEAATEEPSFQLPEPTLQRPIHQPPGLISAAERSAIDEYSQLIPFIHRNIQFKTKTGFEAYVELRCRLFGTFGTIEQANKYYEGIEKTHVTFLGKHPTVHPDMRGRLVKAETWLKQNKGEEWLGVLKKQINSVGGFVIRPNKNREAELSEHSFGTAIDINSKANPNIRDFPAALVKALTREDLFAGEAVKTIRERGQMTDVLPAVKKLHAASETFISRSIEVFKDEKSLKSEFIHYLQGQRIAVKEDNIDKLFDLIKKAHQEKKNNAQKKKKAERSYEFNNALANWLSSARTGAATKEPQELIDFLVGFLMEAYQIFSATRSTGLAGVKQVDIATGHPEVVAAHGFINLQPELIAALVSSDGGGLRWLGTSGGTKDFMHFDFDPAPKPPKDTTASPAPGCEEPGTRQPQRTKQGSRHKKKK